MTSAINIPLKQLDATTAQARPDKNLSGRLHVASFAAARFDEIQR
jgi:hypothetical protein